MCGLCIKKKITNESYQFNYNQYITNPKATNGKVVAADIDLLPEEVHWMDTMIDDSKLNFVKV